MEGRLGGMELGARNAGRQLGVRGQEGGTAGRGGGAAERVAQALQQSGHSVGEAGEVQDKTLCLGDWAPRGEAQCGTPSGEVLKAAQHGRQIGAPDEELRDH